MIFIGQNILLFDFQYIYKLLTDVNVQNVDTGYCGNLEKSFAYHTMFHLSLSLGPCAKLKKTHVQSCTASIFCAVFYKICCALILNCCAAYVRYLRDIGNIGDNVVSFHCSYLQMTGKRNKRSSSLNKERYGNIVIKSQRW